MQITKINLKNFRRHRNLSVSLEPGVIGISGRNGAGKSSLLEGLYYGITGASIGEDNKSALVTWGQRRGEVSLELIIDGKRGVLIRRVGGNVASLEIEGEEKIVGIQAVNAKMSELLGTSISHLREILFVPQENLDAPLRGTEAVRKEAFGKLFGCNRFENIRNVLQNALSTIVDGTEHGMEEQRRILEEAVIAATTEAEAAKAALDCLKRREQEGTPVQELYRIAHATPRSSLDAERQYLQDALGEIDAQLQEFTQEEIAAWDPEKASKRLAHANSVITLFNTGVCPTCGLTGGGTGETLEHAVEVAKQAHDELIRKEKFDGLMTQLVSIDNRNQELNTRPFETDEAIAQAKEALARKAEEEREFREAYSQDGAARSKLESARIALEHHRQREQEAKARTKIAESLVKVRECFHRDALQADVRAYGVGLINSRLSDTLSVFSLPYSIYFNQDGLLKFKSPPSDEEHDFLDLSGGQRKLVALSYRLALMRLFMGNLELAVLDEPTPFVDAENVEIMCESFKSLRKFYAQRGATVLVSTHEKRLFTAFDGIIDL